MTDRSECPDAAALLRFALGQMPPAQVETLAEHVERCALCIHALDGLRAEDTLMQAVAAQANSGSVVTQDIVEGLAARLKARHASLGDAGTAPPESHTPSLSASDADTTQEVHDFLAPPERPDEIGRLGKYRVLKVLGVGGMGVVFLAEDPELRRLVALKALKPALAASAMARRRFVREARAVAALDHDHIVHVYEVGEGRGIPYLTMQLLHGETLEARLRRERLLPVVEVLRIGREAAEGLAAAHAAGMTHRDVKPGNLWLEDLLVRSASEGNILPPARVKLLDFGLARVADDDTSITAAGAVAGTPSHMAPEQARGETVDGRADLFSLGVVLYRLCTGVAPFRGADKISTLLSVATHEPPPPIAVNPSVPAALSALVMRLLSKVPSGRPASAAEVIAALRAIEADPATPAPPAATASSRGRRRTAAVLAAAAGLLVLLVAGTVYFWQTPQGVVRIEIDDPNIQVVFGKDGPIIKGADKHDIALAPGEHGLKVKRGDLEFETEKLILKPRDKVTLRVELLAGKVQVVRDGLVIGAKELPSSAEPKKSKPPSDVKMLPESGAISPCPPGLLVGHTGLVWGVRFLSDGRRAVSVGWDGTVRLWDTATGTEQRIFRPQHQDSLLTALAIAPDDRIVAAGGSYAGVFLWDVVSGKLLRRCPLPTEKGIKGIPVHALAFTSDGQRVVAGLGDGSVCVFRVQDGKHLSQSRISEKSVVALSLLPGDKRIVCATKGEPRVVLWDLETNCEIRRFDCTKTPCGLALNRGGRQLFVGTDRGEVVMWNAETGKRLGNLTGHTGAILGLHPLSGGRLVTTSQDKTVCLWDVAQRRLLVRYKADDHVVNVSDVSPDGQRLLAGGGWQVRMNLERFKDFRLRLLRLPPAPGPAAQTEKRS